MLPSKARWNIGSPDAAKVRELQERLAIRPLLAALLAARGIGAEEAEFFLSAEPEFHDPFLLHGMAAAVERLQRAVRSGEYIRIYGDYDADGVSSTSLMVRLLRQLDARFDYYIPHRVAEGYGLHIPSVEMAYSDGVRLLVTVDTGISAIDQIGRAAELGLDVIVTDHHEPPSELPKALAVINPKISSCNYPFKGLAGVGVAFKLAQAMLGRVPEELAEYAALGTIADLMPLTGENRSIVCLGLERMRRTAYPGFRALLEVAGIDDKALSAGQVAFGLAPRVNAAGRLDSADEAVRLLIADDPQEAAELAQQLDAANRERQDIVEQTALEAFGQVERNRLEETDPALTQSAALIVSSAGWNPGVIGIVASKLVERYYRPSIVLSIDLESGLCKGSARSIPGFHLYEALKACEQWLEHFGGHEAAAGLTIRADRLQSFMGCFEEYASGKLTPEMLQPVQLADAELAISDVNTANIQELDKLAPYGMGHVTPRFVIRGAVVNRALSMGKDGKHIKLALKDGLLGMELDAVGFGMGDAVPMISQGASIDLLGELSVNEWRGRRTPQFIVRDMRIAHKQLYDWRAAASSSAVKEFWELWKLDERASAIIVSEREGIPARFGLWADAVPLYMLYDDGSCKPANKPASRFELECFTDAVLASTPFPFSAFRKLIAQCSSLERVYAAFGNEYAGVSGRCDRSALGAIYTALRSQPSASQEELVRALGCGTGYEAERIRFALQVFRELQLVEETESGAIQCAASPRKRELQESPAYRMEEEAEKAAQYWARASNEWLSRRLLDPMNLNEHVETDQKTEAIS